MILTWSENCAFADMAVRAEGNNADPPAIVSPTGLEFQAADTKVMFQVSLCQKIITKDF